MQRLIVVGGGILGTMHAWDALASGWSVVQLDGDPEPRRASVRNFGMIWVSGRAPGAELDLAIDARERWARIAERTPANGFRPTGSLTVVESPAALAVLEAVRARQDAAARDVRLVDAAEARAINPALHGTVAAALHCRSDALVEPTRVLPALRAAMSRDGRYRFEGGRLVVDVAPGRVTDHRGVAWEGDLVVVCPGARPDGVLPALLGEPGAADGAASAQALQRVRLQMLETEPFPGLTTCVADEDSLRYYPAFDVPERAAMAPAAELVERYRLQLLVAPS